MVQPSLAPHLAFHHAMADTSHYWEAKTGVQCPIDWKQQLGHSTGLIDEEIRPRNTYLAAENCVFRHQIKGLSVDTAWTGASSRAALQAAEGRPPRGRINVGCIFLIIEKAFHNKVSP
jgi:hypothetical protein